VGVRVPTHVRWQRLVQVKKRMVREADQFEPSVCPVPPLAHHPLGDLLPALAVLGAAEDHSDPGQVESPVVVALRRRNLQWRPWLGRCRQPRR
jgi:hypothetical protein